MLSNLITSTGIACEGANSEGVAIEGVAMGGVTCEGVAVDGVTCEGVSGEVDIISFSSDGCFVASDGVLFGYASLESPISWSLLSS